MYAWAKLIYMYAIILHYLVKPLFHIISLIWTLNTCLYVTLCTLTSCHVWFSFAQACMCLNLGLDPLYYLCLLLYLCFACFSLPQLFRFFMNLFTRSHLFPFQRSSLSLLALYRYTLWNICCFILHKCINIIQLLVSPSSYFYAIFIWWSYMYSVISFLSMLYKIIYLYST